MQFGQQLWRWGLRWRRLQQLSRPDLSTLPALGGGLGYRPPFAQALREASDRVDFLEITLEHYLDAGPEKARELADLKSRYTLIPHGLNLSIGSAEGLDHSYLDRVAQLVASLDPPWWSEHVCFTRAGGIQIGHLSPLPFSAEALDVLTHNFKTVSEHLQSPLILENITYMLSLGGELDEAQFLAELCQRTGCGLLLDITNLHINSVNHAYDPYAFIDQLPLESIVQLHFVGGHSEQGMLIDSHSHPTPQAVWDLMDYVLSRAPVKGVILERDENLPEFSELITELERARTLGRQHGRWP